MIRDFFNVCVALVLSARARQIFRRILWRHRTIIAMVAAAAVPVIVMLIPVDYHNPPARYEGLEWRDTPAEVRVISNGTINGSTIAPGTSGQVLTVGGDTTATLPVWSGGTNWTNAPLNVTNGGTGMVVAYRSCTINGSVPAWATAFPATSGTAVTLSSTNMTCYVQR